MVTKHMVELHKVHCIGCNRGYMVKEPSRSPYCSSLCRHMGQTTYKDRPYAARSEMVEIAIPKPTKQIPKYKRIAMMRKAYKEMRADKYLLESDDD